MHPFLTVNLFHCFLTSLGASWFRRVYSTFQPHVEDFWFTSLIIRETTLNADYGYAAAA